MNLNDPRDSFYSDRNSALMEHHRILRLGGKAYFRKYVNKGKIIYRLRVQKNPA